MDNDVLNFLNDLTDASDAVRITEYRVYIGTIEFTVLLRDTGAGSNRYSVEAWPTDMSVEDAQLANAYTLGNADHDLLGALHNAHWDQIVAAAKR